MLGYTAKAGWAKSDTRDENLYGAFAPLAKMVRRLVSAGLLTFLITWLFLQYVLGFWLVSKTPDWRIAEAQAEANRKAITAQYDTKLHTGFEFEKRWQLMSAEERKTYAADVKRRQEQEADGTYKQTAWEKAYTNRPAQSNK